MIYIIALATCASTLLGGLFALRLKDKLHLILGFSAGAVIGVAFFDLLPEALELSAGSHGISMVTSVVALGFLIYLILDRMVFHHLHEEDAVRGTAGAGTLTAHSFLDGIAIGLGFQVSAALGIVVALAVLAHDFSDGINTVNFVVKNNGDRKNAIRWLIIDAIAPVLGILATSFFAISEQDLGILLAVFAGFFLYIGASDLIPESHHAHPTRFTTFMTVVGATVLYVIINIAG
jgi:ZIP family zinc transporter